MPTYYRFNYAIRNPKGDVVDTSFGGEPLSFVEGDGRMIPGLEKAVLGRNVGDTFSVTIDPEDAYGLPQRQLIRTVPRAMIQTDADEVEPGMVFQVGTDEQQQVVKVVAVVGNDITIDANHPLAGISFNFDVEILEVRQADPGDVA